MPQSDWPKIDAIRREYGRIGLLEDSVAANPITQFKLWFEDVLKHEKADPGAMVLSTVDKAGQPDSRVVLLKGIDEEAFFFYTNYQSTKACQLAANACCALNFYWPQMVRQVRIRGNVAKTSRAVSEAYFSSRPLTSRIAAIISAQSHPLPDRASLDEAFNHYLKNVNEKDILCPSNWGGYRVIPSEVEFWQGRDNRLHDRLLYKKENNTTWAVERLAP